MTDTSFTTKEFDAILRIDFQAFMEKAFAELNPGKQFVDGEYIQAMTYSLVKVANRETGRLVITMPPRYLKTHCTTISFVAWLLGKDPTLKIVCVSYNEKLAHDFSIQCRKVMKSDWYKRVFPNTVIDADKDTAAEFWTTKGGARIATSIGGTVTGKGGDIIILDDQMKADDALSQVARTKSINSYRNTLLSRPDDKSAARFILVGQRLHIDDLVGYILENEEWGHLNLPAIATEHQEIEIGEGLVWHRAPGDVLHKERETREDLDKLKKAMGPFAFEAQYQQSPVPEQGNLFKKEWMQRYDKPPSADAMDMIVISCDTASSEGENNSYSACLVFGVKDKRYYLLDVHRGQWLYTDLRRNIIKLCQGFPSPVLLIEKASSGLQLIPDLSQNSSFNPIGIPPEKDKAVRFGRESVAIEEKRLFLPKDGPFIADFEKELLTFPMGKHDDQVDALTQFLYWMRQREQPKPTMKVYTMDMFSDGPSDYDFAKVIGLDKL